MVTFKEFLHIVACYDYCKCSFLRLSLKAATPLCRPPKDATNVPPRCVRSRRVESQIQWKMSLHICKTVIWWAHLKTVEILGEIYLGICNWLVLTSYMSHKACRHTSIHVGITWLKIHLMINSTPSLSRILELSLKSSDSSSVDQDHAGTVRDHPRWFAVRLKRPDHPLQEDRGRC